jgi:hypothetical protein
MMWRGTLYSTLLHGSIVVAIVGGLPILPNIFDRTEEPETESTLSTGSSELPISIEIVSADTVDLQQNVIAPRNQETGQPVPPAAGGRLQPLIIGQPDTIEQPNAASPPQDSARTRIPDGALDLPKTNRTGRCGIA